jgi:DNA polymerase (family 10)
MHNRAIAELFEEIADMLELEDGNRFEIVAYRKAAESIGSMQEDLKGVWEHGGTGKLMEMPGIGQGLARKIEEYFKTGRMGKHEKLKKKYPIDFASLTRIQGLGPKRIFRLYAELGIRDISGLRAAVEEHRVAGLDGFGDRSEEEIGKALDFFDRSAGRMPLGIALPEAERIIKGLLDSGQVEEARLAGSVRRMKETVGDLDILMIAEDRKGALRTAASLPEVSSVKAEGGTKATVWLKSGISCDFRVVGRESFGSAMQYFTGSKEHGIALRKIAIKKGMKLSEYGVFDRTGRAVAGRSEEEVYKALGMDCIPPEMREGIGEIDLAISGALPRLVEQEDIRGDLHMHTKNSDGNESVYAMAKHAAGLGLEYIGISDHTESERVAHGMDSARFARYAKEIDDANERLGGRIRIFMSAEIDILKDGSMDMGRRELGMLNYRIGAVHTSRGMQKKEMTDRIVKALESGSVDILAHPTGRLINSREPFDIDLDRVFAAAKENGVVMEIDASPERLDLNAENIIRAKEHGLLFSIGTDSHSIQNMGFMRYGVGTARRGWLGKDVIINSMGLKKFEQFVAKRN